MHSPPSLWRQVPLTSAPLPPPQLSPVSPVRVCCGLLAGVVPLLLAGPDVNLLAATTDLLLHTDTHPQATGNRPRLDSGGRHAPSSSALDASSFSSYPSQRQCCLYGTGTREIRHPKVPTGFFHLLPSWLGSRIAKPIAVLSTSSPVFQHASRTWSRALSGSIPRRYLGLTTRHVLKGGPSAPRSNLPHCYVVFRSLGAAEACAITSISHLRPVARAWAGLPAS